MKNLNELLYGSDYSEKLELFNKKTQTIHENYDGDFDTNGYFILETCRENGKVKLTFDQDKNIPKELKDSVLAEFNNIWK